METLVEKTNEVLDEPRRLTPLPSPDAKQLRVEHVGKLLEKAYGKASTLKLKKEEWEQLRADFPDEAIETRSHDGLHYISHMELRERLWSVFQPGEIAEICRERMMRTDSNEIGVDLVLVIRGHFAAEAIGTAKYYPNNPKGSFGDTVESAWSEALRRCCKKFGVGTQVWRPTFLREFDNRRATKRQESRERKAAPAKEYKLDPKRATALPADEKDDDRIPF